MEEPAAVAGVGPGGEGHTRGACGAHQGHPAGILTNPLPLQSILNRTVQQTCSGSHKFAQLKDLFGIY